MIIPQFSLRWMLAAMTLLAAVFLIVARAVQGSPWAIGVTGAVIMLVVVMTIHAGLFFLTWLASLVGGRWARSSPAAAARRVAEVDSPFAASAGSTPSPATQAGSSEGSP